MTEEEIKTFLAPDPSSPGYRLWNGPWPHNTCVSKPLCLFFHLFLAGRWLRYPWGKWIPTVTAGGAEGFAYMLGTLPEATDPGDPSTGPLPKNATLYGVALAAMLQLARTADPTLRWAHIANEPNAHIFGLPAAEAYADFFTTAASVIKKSVPALNLGGPVLCWPLTTNQPGQNPDWFTWSTWTQPLLDRAIPAGVLDFIDFHS